MPDYYGNRVTVADTSGDPTSWKEVMASQEKAKWVNAMEKQMEYLHTNEVWDLVELSKDKKAVGSICVYVTGFWKTDRNVTLGLFHFIGPANGYTHILHIHTAIVRLG